MMFEGDGGAWLGIDLGTQSVRALLVTGDGRVLGAGAAPLTGQRDGTRHEQDPEEWWKAVCTASRAALTGQRSLRLGGLAVCGTSGTVLLTDPEGRPLTPALMYDDGRAAPEAARVGTQPSWALPKALWLLEAYGRGRITHQPDVITARLTGGTTIPTDSSHALKTGYDAEHEAWPPQLAHLGEVLPEVVRPGTRLGEVSRAAAEATGIPAGTPVVAGMTDGCAAQIASGALRVGAWNSVLGTTLVLKGASARPVRDDAGVVYNHRAPDGSWLPGGASSVGAGALPTGADPAEMDSRAADHEPSGVLTYPLSSPGERFPFLAPEATAFTLGTPASEADRWAAVLQGVAFTERLCLDYLHYLGAPIDGPLTFTGGAARSAYWNQLRADVLGRPARVPEQIEPALGMAVLAAYGTGATASLVEAADRMVRIRTVLEPRASRTARFVEPYARLVDELETRGWLPTPLATHTRTRLNQKAADS
ncbi:carbohydrate kinase [Streptomyces sp. MBT65]|uniref:FGGY-family carbohydrate kinase n=1 Tax=Streptomyces sp. MBT65 TaxID=1488395 RepID=UPI00190A749B|nr:FGGY-family carbohydrate kinase [Streptomyces sp. MBT65]MBK3579981.1 carbohydrate kinase [Streptomyces sp. MBT65]